MKKIVVNKEACIGCGACVSIADEYFAFDDDGLSMPIKQDDLNNSDLASAIDSCPTSAISIKDVDDTEETKEKDDECCEGKCDCCKHHEEA